MTSALVWGKGAVGSAKVVVTNAADAVKHALTASRDDFLTALGNAEKRLSEVGQNLRPASALAGVGKLPPGTPVTDALTRLLRTTDTPTTARTDLRGSGGGGNSIGFEARLSNGDVFSASLRGEILTVKDISVKSFEYTKRDRGEAAQLRKDFDRGIRGEFLKGLAQKQEDLRRLGFDDVDVARMRDGLPHEGVSSASQASPGRQWYQRFRQPRAHQE
ncbi:hypothetical protein J2Y69_000083 [Microbacterium resistens]|uniref:Uncharacterized protein n=1 Tax=Microbacterium resistens TaxID=156977 RepID=A0ABU1S789_9MICO|nr:hypothetical protein [Microbacterium resistens]MDR6865501.1 hypothetical protein [Microbacterium resistens]